MSNTDTLVKRFRDSVMGGNWSPEMMSTIYRVADDPDGLQESIRRVSEEPAIAQALDEIASRRTSEYAAYSARFDDDKKRLGSSGSSNE